MTNQKKYYEHRGIKFFIPSTFKDDWGDVIYSPTLIRVKNLIDMAHAIQKSPPPRFEMGTFNSFGDDYYYLIENGVRVWDSQGPQDFCKVKPILMARPDTIKEGGSCGTSACAIGTAAFHGIAKPHLYDDWGSYAERAFGIYEGQVFEFLFGGYWSSYDNTEAGAVARILMLVIEGPRVINYYTWKVDQYRAFKGIVIND